MKETSKPGYRWRTVRGALIAVATPLANVAGFGMTAVDEVAFADAVTAFVTACGGLIAIIGRIRAAHRLR
ncbi:hypothetical protein LXM94_21715 [Rhizobium sp. TRM95111]|uniref:hypothetical protein n=1 Tax=Rhizobium alarense TaxID=2846851 RepID=UPI001F28C89E|nr:hypothetical protein [Rhizobium alarense]MCF3642593.1 hypothetical protein [Rhizobium alarense]